MLYLIHLGLKKVKKPETIHDYLLEKGYIVDSVGYKGMITRYSNDLGIIEVLDGLFLLDKTHKIYFYTGNKKVFSLYFLPSVKLLDQLLTEYETKKNA